MEWMECEQADRDKRMLIVENDAAFVRALGRALRLPFCALLVSENDLVSDILNALQDKSDNVNVLYLDAQLMFRECPDPSYYGGVELCKHIRLTPSLEPLSLLPIVIGTVDMPAYCIQRAVDNTILFSPGCEAIKLPTLLVNLCDALHRYRPFSDEKQLHQAIRPFVLFTDADERIRSHAHLNRAGVGKFLKEFVGSIVGEDHPQFQQYQHMLQTELWLKKMYFLNPALCPGDPVSQEEAEELWNACRHHRFLFIDDEHRYGWSFGLYTGLFGQLGAPSVFEKEGHMVETPDGQLLCIDSYPEAVGLFQAKAEELEKALETWAKAEYEEWQKSRVEAKARRRRDQAKQTVSRANEESETIEENWRLAQEQYQRVQVQVRQQLEAFGSLADTMMDVLTEPEGDALDLLQQMPSLRDSIENLNQVLTDYESARQSYEQAKERTKAAQETLSRAEENWRRAAEEFKKAQKEREVAVRTLRRVENGLREIFPYSLVFLDLRLEQPADEHRFIEAVTGIRLLAEIKRLFPDCPVIVMTASEKALSSEKARELGADGYWIKGVSSGKDLWQAICECLEKAQLKEIWLAIREVEKKREIHCFEWKVGSLVPCVLEEHNLERMLIERWLWESFFLLWQGAGIRNAAICSSDYPYDHVILNMGRIQELRYRDVRDEQWTKLPQGERELHTRRNEVAHALKLGMRGNSVRNPCDREEAIGFVMYSLERLLKQRHSV